MITVKHVIDQGNEEIYQGTHVQYHRCQENPCELREGIKIHDRLLLVKSITHGGAVYVMNSEGQTIATYHLPDLPTDVAAPPQVRGVQIGGEFC